MFVALCCCVYLQTPYDFVCVSRLSSKNSRTQKSLSHYRLSYIEQILCKRMKRANSSDYTETHSYALEYTLMLKKHIHGFTHIELH